MILEIMWQRYNNLIYIKNGLMDKGHNFKSLSYLNAQIELLEALIHEESFNSLNQLLMKTNYRLLRQIKKGELNLINIINYPTQWRLCNIQDHNDEWLNNDSLIFSTEREILCFTQAEYGQRYINNKWQ